MASLSLPIFSWNWVHEAFKAPIKRLTESEYTLLVENLRADVYVVAAVYNSRPLPACLPLYNAADDRAVPRPGTELGRTSIQVLRSVTSESLELIKLNGLPSTWLK